jgi:hypothetical protein
LAKRGAVANFRLEIGHWSASPTSRDYMGCTDIPPQIGVNAGIVNFPVQGFQRRTTSPLTPSGKGADQPATGTYKKSGHDDKTRTR